MDLREYDVILVNSSAGKDSQVALDVVCTLAGEQGVLDRITVLHNDLGRVEWPGTAELAKTQAERYGVRFEMRHREQGDLLEQVRQRGMWPDKARRYCTSDQKRGPKHRMMTQLVRELGLSRPARVLDVTGERADESADRANKPAFEVNKAATNKTMRHVWTWRPIHTWTESQVWERIRATGIPHHWAYDAGMSRLSCSFCVFASKSDLQCAARLRPDLAAEYVALEAEIGHDFKQGQPIASIVAEVLPSAA